MHSSGASITMKEFALFTKYIYFILLNKFKFYARTNLRDISLLWRSERIGTIHVVVGGGGSHLPQFTTLNTRWSALKDYDWEFVKLTTFNQSPLLFEYKKSKDVVKCMTLLQYQETIRMSWLASMMV
ncbi:hypothetical protein H5410_035481, partial [Solanum commersonii]